MISNFIKDRAAIDKWKSEHTLKHHIYHDPKEPRKYVSKAPEYKLVAYETVLDPVVEVVCEECEKKALRRCFGSVRRYEKLLERYGAVYHVEPDGGQAEDSRKKKIYLTRESFCYADDGSAPNIQVFEWADNRYAEPDLRYTIEEYLGPNLPAFAWRGFSNGKKIVDVIAHKDPKAYCEISFADNWRDTLRKTRCIHFVHKEIKDKDKLPEALDNPKRYYSFEEAEDICKEHHNR